MRAEDPAIDALAASVADGDPVDWQAAESRTADVNRRLVRHLRLVHNMSALYRSIPDEPAGALSPTMTAAAPPEPDGPRWGRLVILESIGRGTSGDVCRAWDRELHREVALKLLNDGADKGPIEEAHARVLQEARRLARVRHPHIVQVYGAEEHEGRVGLWMELVRGESLEQILAARGPFGAAEAGVIGQDLCAALAAVHGAGLLHRDVKAQNVLREQGGRTVLMDFGTGEELRRNAGAARVVGTPLYLAPEIFAGRHASVQSDLYSVGVLLFYLVTGRFPVAASSIEQLARAHAHGGRRRLRDLRPELPAAFVRTIERALDPDPGARFRTSGEMEAALGEARGDRPSVSSASWRDTLQRRPAFAAGILAAVLLLAVVGSIVWSRATQPVRSVASRTITSVAVLPLTDVSGSSATPFLADGLTDQLIATLGQIQALRVASLTSVLPFKQKLPPIQQVFDTLRVDAVVEGTIAVTPSDGGTPGRVRVNARLLSAGSGTQLWSQSLERPLGDILALQADLARQIATAVQATVTESESRRLTQVRSTNPAAEEAYFQGRYHLRQYGIERARRALEAFTRATSLDEGHAAAWAGAARCHISLGFDGAISQPEARASALAQVNRALSLNEELPDVHAVLADLKFYYDWDWPGSEREYRRAIDLNPSFTYARSQYARYLAAARRLNEAAAESATARELDPLSAEAAQTDGLIRYYSRDFDGAIEALQRALEIDPGYARAHYVLGRVHEANGRAHDARTETTKALQLARTPGVSWRLQDIRLQAAAGEVDQARRRLSQTTRDLGEQNLRINAEDLAYFHAAVGEPDRAFEYLRRAVDERDPAILWIAVDPRVDALRGDPRFAGILRRIGLVQP